MSVAGFFVETTMLNLEDLEGWIEELEDGA